MEEGRGEEVWVKCQTRAVLEKCDKASGVPEPELVVGGVLHIRRWVCGIRKAACREHGLHVKAVVDFGAWCLDFRSVTVLGVKI